MEILKQELQKKVFNGDNEKRDKKDKVEEQIIKKFLANQEQENSKIFPPPFFQRVSFYLSFIHLHKT